MSSVADSHPRHKSKRLASDIIGQLEDRLALNDRDIPTWLELIERTVQKDKIESVREVYERFLKKFPFLTKQWVAYIDYEVVRGEFDNANNILGRCLKSTTSVDLWKCYVNFIRRKHSVITGGDEARRVIFQAYETATNQVGTDPGSGSLWSEYLAFIDDWKAGSTWDEQQKMDMKRKVFKRALHIPLNNLEQLWSDYTVFENDLNATTARKFISETSGDYMNARSLFKEWNNITQGLDRSFETPPQVITDPSQLQKWTKWVKWEKQNKMAETPEVVAKRVDYVYKQAVQKLTFSPELWFDYVSFYEESEFFSAIRVQELLNMSLLANPTSFALNFKLIELYELDNNTALVEKKFDNLIAHLHKEFERADGDLTELKESILSSEIERKKATLAEDEELKPFSAEETEAIFKRSSAVQEQSIELHKMAEVITKTYCHYMKAIKRIKSLQDARGIFKQCRNNKKTLTHHIFAENAYMENTSTGKNVALKVFELGLKPGFFANDGEYIYKYLKFLIKVNDDINSRTVFETTITTKKELIEPKWLKKMFKLFMKYEVEFGQVASVVKLEKKYYEAFPDDAKILSFADRYSLSTEQDDYSVTDDLVRSVDLKMTDSSVAQGTKRRSDDSEQNANKRQHIADDTETSEKAEEEKGEEDDDDGSEYVSDEIYNLLRMLPNSSYFDTPLFNTSKLVKLLGELQ